MTAHRHADYVYRNADDSVRVRVYRREGGRWDYDVFYPDAIETYSEEAGDDFSSKRSALADATRRHGSLRSVATAGVVVDDAWRRRAASTSTRSHASRKTPAQLDREIAETLAKYASTPEPGGYGSGDEGVFYLTDTREQPLGPKFRSRLAAKRAALKLVRDGTHPRVEVWHRWRGDRYMQGLASEEGWSDV